mmetsp:Transcript_52725/g.140668  ORF Transcript_52725/g.140668 Transcript_52725/m.140668 type:complete len:215 (-) Transcript_52725:331-975(-)
MKMTRSTSDIQITLDPTPFAEHRVVPNHNVLTVENLPSQELDDAGHITFGLENFVRRIFLVQTNCGKGGNIHFLALGSELDTVDLQELHSDLVAISVDKLPLLAYLVGGLVPRGMELPTMYTPICVELNKSEIVDSHCLGEIIVFEVIMCRAPVSVQCSLLLWSRICQRIVFFQQLDLLLRVRMALLATSVGDRLESECVRAGKPFIAELVPHR